MNTLRRIVFLGSPDFALPSLKRLIDSEQFRPLAVVTQPDRGAGRKMQLMPTPIKVLAAENNMPVFQPEDINAQNSLDYILSLKPDMLVTVAYGQKLKKAVRAAAVHGAVNLHPSLLPELRGAAPIPFALWQGMIQTGITIFKLSGRMDAGAVFFRKPLLICPTENATELAGRMAHIGSMCLIQFLTSYFRNPHEPEPQDEEKATYCRKLVKEDLIINWHNPAVQIHNHIRALSYTPGAYTVFRGQQLKILETKVIDKDSTCQEVGTITQLLKNNGFVIQARDKQLLIEKVQPAGKKMMTAWAYHLGAKLQIGERLC